MVLVGLFGGFWGFLLFFFFIFSFLFIPEPSLLGIINDLFDFISTDWLTHPGVFDNVKRYTETVIGVRLIYLHVFNRLKNPGHGSFLY